MGKAVTGNMAKRGLESVLETTSEKQSRIWASCEGPYSLLPAGSSNPNSHLFSEPPVAPKLTENPGELQGNQPSQTAVRAVHGELSAKDLSLHPQHINKRVKKSYPAPSLVEQAAPEQNQLPRHWTRANDVTKRREGWLGFLAEPRTRAG